MSKILHIGADTYRMDIFPLPVTVETNPMPLDILTSAGKAWLSCEFDRRIYNIPTNAVDGTEMAAVEIPTPAGLYRTTATGPDLPSLMGMSEDIDVDASGNILLAQSGINPYAGPETNLARLLRYNPATDVWQAFMLPYNNAGAVSLLADGDSVSVTCADGLSTAALATTRPHSWLRADTDMPTALGAVNANGLRGWQIVPLTAGTWPAHQVKGPDGRTYITNYFGNSVIAINRTTLAVQNYPLPAGATGPWQIRFDLGGGLWVTCDTSRHLVVLNTTTGIGFAYPTGLSTDERLHSLELISGVFWFTAYSNTTGGRIGRRTAAGVMELSEPLDTLGIDRGCAGIAAEGSTPFVALFGSKAVGRLTKI